MFDATHLEEAALCFNTYQTAKNYLSPTQTFPVVTFSLTFNIQEQCMPICAISHSTCLLKETTISKNCNLYQENKLLIETSFSIGLLDH